MTNNGHRRLLTQGELPRRVLILRALQLGDLVCAVPALRALRRGLPDARLVLAGLPWAREFTRRFANLLDDFIEFPGYPGLPERCPQLSRIPEFLREVQAQRFDLAIQLHGSGSIVNPLVALFGADRCAGFYVPGEYCPDSDWFMPWPEEGLEVARLVALVEFLGMPNSGEHLEFPIHAGDYGSLCCLSEVRELRPGRFVCVHPGASVPERRWPIERFSLVVRRLARRGFRIVITGTTQEAHLTGALAECLGGEALDLAGRTSLGQVAALLSACRLLLCNDTGVSHLAAALRVPSVVISTGDNPKRWAPANRNLHRVLAHPLGVSPAEVIAHAESLLDNRDLEPASRSHLAAWPRSENSYTLA